MIVVSDTSPITGLLRIQEDSLLTALFGRVIVPPAVQQELLRFHLQLPDSLIVHEISNPAEVPKGLDRGEAEAIALARELRADYLLIDEKKGRIIAKNLGLRPIGLAAIVIAAKRANLIQSAASLLEALRTKGGVYMGEELQAEVIRQCGEDQG